MYKNSDKQDKRYQGQERLAREGSLLVMSNMCFTVCWIMHKYKREKFHILMECYSLVWLITERKLAHVQCIFVLTL